MTDLILSSTFIIAALSTLTAAVVFFREVIRRNKLKTLSKPNRVEYGRHLVIQFPQQVSVKPAGFEAAMQREEQLQNHHLQSY